MDGEKENKDTNKDLLFTFLALVEAPAQPAPVDAARTVDRTALAALFVVLKTIHVKTLMY